MSLVNQQTITCPACGRKEEITVWQSLNTQLNSEAKDLLLAGTLLRFTCPACGAVNTLCYPLLYHEADKQIMVYLTPTAEDQKEANQAITSQKKLLNGAVKYTFRIVTTANALREKAIIFEHGLDDRVIEFLKLIYIQQAQEKNPDLQVDTAYFLERNGKFYMQIFGNRSLEAEMDLSNYNNAKNNLADLIADDESLIVDSKWAMTIVRKVSVAEADNTKKETISPSPAETPVQDVITCSKCGHALPGDSEFCQYCGNSLTSASDVQNVSTAPWPQTATTLKNDQPALPTNAPLNTQTLKRKQLFSFFRFITLFLFSLASFLA